MIKRIIVLCMLVSLMAGLTACSHEHQWEEATCTAPRTCSACKETEGENLGHTWVDATCTDPETCTRCGETQGEPLPHTWRDANHQQPKTCTVCSATEGEPLTTYFEEYGLDDIVLELDGTYELPMVCYQNENKTTVAKVTVEDYQTIASDDTHQALEGYEWKIMTFKILLDDENAQKYGFMGYNYLWMNRYEDTPAEESEDDDGVIDDLFVNGVQQTFQWNGVEYEDGWVHIKELNDGWQKNHETGSSYFEIMITVSVRAPIGHDEFVMGFETTDWEWPEGTYLHEIITENTLLFRFR